MTTKQKDTGTLIQGMTNLADAFGIQDTIRTERQGAELLQAERATKFTQKANQQAQTILDESFETGTQHRQAQLDVLDQIGANVEIANEAMRLSDSDDPLDRVKLWFLQQGDNRYTAEGNTRRLQYLQTASGAIGLQNVIQQEQYQAAISNITSNLELQLSGDAQAVELLKVQERQGQERIDAALNYNAAVRDQIMTDNATRELALSNASVETLQSMAQGMAERNKRSAELMGSSVSATQVEQELLRRRNQELAMDGLEHNARIMHLNAMNLADVRNGIAVAEQSKDGMARIKDMDFTLAQLQARELTLRSQANAGEQATLDAHALQEQKFMMHQTNTLENLSMSQLQQVKADGYMLTTESGQKIAMEPALVEAQIQTELDRRAGIVGADMLRNQGNVPMTELHHQASAIEMTLSRLHTNSPIRRQLENQLRGIRFAAGAEQWFDENGEIRDANAAQQVGQLLTDAGTALQNAIQSEAERLGKGDDALVDAYVEQLSGRPVDWRDTSRALTEAAKTDQGLSKVALWLTPEQTALFKTAFYDSLAQIQAAQYQGGWGNISESNARGMAAEQAFAAVRQVMSNQMTQSVLSAQGNDIKLMTESGAEISLGAQHQNPLSRRMSGAQILTLYNQADDEGLRQFAASELGADLTDEQLEMLRQGQDIPDMGQQQMQRLRQGLAIAQTGAVLHLMDMQYPGLAVEYTNWWNSPNSRAFLQQYEMLQGAGQSQSFEGAVNHGMVREFIPTMGPEHAAQLNLGSESQAGYELQQKSADYLTFGGNIETQQVYLTQQIPGLSTVDKQTIMTQIVQPLVAQVMQDAPDASGAEHRTLFERQLRFFRSDNANIQQLYRKFMEGRDGAIQAYQDLIQLSDHQRRQGGISTTMTQSAYDQQLQQQVDSQLGNFEWWIQLQGEQ